jgi:hypothetical protein
MSQPENPVPYPKNQAEFQEMTENFAGANDSRGKDWRTFVVHVIAEREIEVGAAVSMHKDYASAVADAVNAATDIAKKQVERGGKEWSKHVRVQSVRHKGGSYHDDLSRTRDS